MNRRQMLGLVGLGGLGALALPAIRAMGAPAQTKTATEFFVFIHALGGWDVTLSLDPRNEAIGIIDPATTANCDKNGVRSWVDRPFAGGARTFEILQPQGSKLRFGPAIGHLAELADRLTIINGVSMNTVSHTDGSVFSATGRHLDGGRVAASSIDAVLASELGCEQIFPSVSVNFPSYAQGLDRRATPLRVSGISGLTGALVRSQAFETPADRDAVTALLTEEARDLARKSHFPGVFEGFALQYEALRAMLHSDLRDALTAEALRKAYPSLDYTRAESFSAAFALEGMKRNVVRCTAFAAGSFDDHGITYRGHAQKQQALFDLVAAFVRAADAIAHPTLPGHKLSDHMHVLVLSEFCRTPQLNVGGGRDHYPNNSALAISPKLRGNLCFGGADREQLLPMPVKSKSFIAPAPRPVGPPDILATPLSAFGIEPHRYMRDGEVVKELLA
ncbi:MAG: DUF1501 domain-containing protein [Polyangiales bacterium]